MKLHLRLLTILLLLLSTGSLHLLKSQHCTRLGIEYYEIFNYEELDEATIQLLDKLLISFFSKLPYPLERDEKLNQNFEKKVYQQLPDSIQQKISLSRFIYFLAVLQDLYTIESNGFSIAYNQQVANFTSQYHLEGMSPQGIETFVFQFVDHMSTLFDLENMASPNRVSPIKLKQMVLEEYKQFLSDADLMILASGWDKKIEEFIADARKRDSAYAVSLQILVPKIDSLVNLFYSPLEKISSQAMDKLSLEEREYLTTMAQQYLNTIETLKLKETYQMQDYYGVHLQNVIMYHEYFYELKKIFPSSNFWSWRKGPRINISEEHLKSDSEYLNFYGDIEDEMVAIIDKYAANFAYPNYYFSGSQTYSAEKIKSIQITNAFLFAAIHNQ